MWSTYYLSVKSPDISGKNWNHNLPWSFSWIFCGNTSCRNLYQFSNEMWVGMRDLLKKRMQAHEKTFCWVQKTHRAFYSSSAISVLQSCGWNFPWSLQYFREMKSQKKTCTAGYAVVWLKWSKLWSMHRSSENLKGFWKELSEGVLESFSEGYLCTYSLLRVTGIARYVLRSAICFSNIFSLSSVLGFCFALLFPSCSPFIALHKKSHHGSNPTSQ